MPQGSILACNNSNLTNLQSRSQRDRQWEWSFSDVSWGRRTPFSKRQELSDSSPWSREWRPPVLPPPLRTRSDGFDPGETTQWRHCRTGYGTSSSLEGKNRVNLWIYFLVIFLFYHVIFIPVYNLVNIYFNAKLEKIQTKQSPIYQFSKLFVMKEVFVGEAIRDSLWNYHNNTIYTLLKQCPPHNTTHCLLSSTNASFILLSWDYTDMVQGASRARGGSQRFPSTGSCHTFHSPESKIKSC